MSLFSCRDNARLVSESLDHTLPLGQRLSLRFHLLICRNCTRFHGQLQFINRAARRFPEQVAADEAEQVRLSAEARERIKRAMEETTS